MADGLPSVPPPPTALFRIARKGSAFDPPPWRFVGSGRFDDPRAAERPPTDDRFRVIYLASSLQGAFAEVLARFRTSPRLLSELLHIRDAQRLDPESLRGLVPRDWLNQRQIISVQLDPGLQFVDLMDARTVQQMRRTLAPIAIAESLEDIDLGALVGPQRRLTQAVARHVYEQTRHAGIRYVSRLGMEWECWAVFDGRGRPQSAVESGPLTADNPALLEVASLFDLSIDG